MQTTPSSAAPTMATLAGGSGGACVRHVCIKPHISYEMCHPLVMDSTAASASYGASNSGAGGAAVSGAGILLNASSTSAVRLSTSGSGGGTLKSV